MSCGAASLSIFAAVFCRATNVSISELIHLVSSLSSLHFRWVVFLCFVLRSSVFFPLVGFCLSSAYCCELVCRTAYMPNFARSKFLIGASVLSGSPIKYDDRGSQCQFLVQSIQTFLGAFVPYIDSLSSSVLPLSTATYIKAFLCSPISISLNDPSSRLSIVMS